MGCSQMNKVIEKVLSSSMLMSSILTSCNLQTASNVSAMENVSKYLKEIAKVLYNDIKRYWDMRDINWHIENEEHNSDEINVVYRNFFDSGNII